LAIPISLNDAASCRGHNVVAPSGHEALNFAEGVSKLRQGERLWLSLGADACTLHGGIQIQFMSEATVTAKMS